MTGDESDDKGTKARIVELLKELSPEVEEYLESYPETTTFEISAETFCDFDVGLYRDWQRNPDSILAYLSESIKVVLDEWGVEEAETVADRTTFRLVGFVEEYLYDVGQYSPDDVAGRMLHLRGQVTKRSKRHLRDEVLAFDCSSCGYTTYVPQNSERLQRASECSDCGRSGTLELNDQKSRMRNFQSVRLQTLPEESKSGDTEYIDVRLYDDLVGSLAPGDRAVMTGVMSARRVKQHSRNRELYVDTHSITKLDSDVSDIDVTEHEAAIREIAESDDPYTPVIESVAPFHTGDEIVKEALALQLFGGFEKELPNGKWFRGNSHILLMGDPGVGKTAIIRYISELVPRAEYASGKKSTSAGLTATAVKDEFVEGGWTLQAGTLVRANNGLACIDELDKMDKDDRDGMIQAMSEQEITVSMVVSGILPAKCAVLAAANPKYGTFDPNTDIGHQLDLDEVLLSRFDLWFVMRDEPDEELDEAIASTMTETAHVGQRLAAGEELTEEDMELIDPPIPPEMFRAYVAMGKRCFPSFTDDAKDRIVREYVELRQINDDDAPVPTTVRMVEALHRLSEASARIRLSDDIILSDVERAIDIFWESLESLGIDPDTGELDARKFETGTPSSAREREKLVLGIIEGQSTDDEPAERSEVKEEAMVVMDEAKFDRVMEKLHDRGDVYEPSTGTLRVA